MKVDEFISKYNVKYEKINIRQWGSYEIGFVFFNDPNYRICFGQEDIIYGWGIPLDIGAKLTLIEFAHASPTDIDFRLFISKFGQGVFDDFRKIKKETWDDLFPVQEIPKESIQTALVKYKE
jgi:hypothetical protein